MSTQPHDEALHPRETTGKFRAKPTSEASGGLDALAAAPTPETVQRETQAEFAQVLAEHLGADYSAVELVFDNAPSCGTPHGHAHTGSEVAIPGDALNSTVEFNAELDANGATVRTSVTVNYDIEPVEERGYTRDSVSIDTPYRLPVEPSELPRAIEAVKVKAGIQRAAEAEFNRRQREFNVADQHGSNDSYRIVDVSVLEVHGTPPREVIVEVEDRSDRGTPSVRFMLDAATGRPIGGSMNTPYGHITLDDENLHSVAGGMYQKLAFAMRDFDEVSGSTNEERAERLTARFAKMLGV